MIPAAPRLALALAIAIAACAPVIDGPIERQRAIDRDDAARLASQLGVLPGVVHAEVALHRAVRDPLSATATATAAGGAIILIVDDRADRAALAATARRIAAALAPEVGAGEPDRAGFAIVVEVGATRPVLAKVGPFTVEQASRGPLKAALGTAFALVLALAAWIAWRERARRS